MTSLARVPKKSSNGKPPPKPRKKELLDASSWPKVGKKVERLLALAVGASTEEEARTAAVALARIIDRHDLKITCAESPAPVEHDALLAPARPGETWASRAGFGEVVGFTIIWQDRRDPFQFGFLSHPGARDGRPMVFMNPNDAFREVARTKLYQGHSSENLGYGVVPVHRF